MVTEKDSGETAKKSRSGGGRVIGALFLLIGFGAVLYGMYGIPAQYNLDRASAMQITQVLTESIQMMVMGLASMLLGVAGFLSVLLNRD